jgi:HD-GYP domain-containing protein (c-di-GMP phosphodiesterase class II)
MAERDIRSDVGRIIMLVASAVQTESVYGRDHSLAKEEVAKLYSALREGVSARHDITIGIIGSEVAFEKEPFYEISRKLERFIVRLKEMKIEKISFLKGLDEREVGSFIGLLAGTAKYREKPGDAEGELKALGVKHVTLGSIGPSDAADEDGSPKDAQADANRDFREGINFLEETFGAGGRDKPVDAKAARFVIGRIAGSLLKNAAPLLILTSLKRHDEYAFVHSLNVSIFTLIQAETLGLGEPLMGDIGVAALLHDIGKLSVEASIMQKEEPYSREEAEKMRRHSAAGSEALLKMPDVPVLAAIAAFEHHIWYDTQGYPSRLYGDRLNLVSMMIAIADAYDLMRSARYYKDSLPAEKVYEEMAALSGKKFNPVLLEAFFKRVGTYPPGTLVELEDGSIGLVVKESVVHPSRPQVEILYNGRGEEERPPHIANLLERDASTGLFKRTIAKSIPVTDKHSIPDKYTT